MESLTTILTGLMVFLIIVLCVFVVVGVAFSLVILTVLFYKYVIRDWRQVVDELRRL